jgi:hypothetical protein
MSETTFDIEYKDPAIAPAAYLPPINYPLAFETGVTQARIDALRAMGINVVIVQTHSPTSSGTQPITSPTPPQAPPTQPSLVMFHLDVTVTGGGYLVPQAGPYNASSGTYTFKSFANSGWSFVDWILDGVHVSAPTISVEMNKDHILNAGFAQNTGPAPLPIQQPAPQPTVEPPTNWSRPMGPFGLGLPKPVLHVLWILREHYIRKEVHKKLHPWV